MEQKEKVFINAPADRIWQFIENPANLQSWNPKVKEVSVLGNASFYLGYVFGIQYEMNNRVSEFRGEIVDYRQPDRLTFHFSGGNLPPGSFVEEEFTLDRKDTVTLLQRVVRYNVSGIPLWAKTLVWLLFHLGKPTGEPYLNRLKAIVEGSH